MITAESASETIDTMHLREALADGPVQGGLLPMWWIKGRVYVLENCLHFFPGNPEALHNHRRD